jgi:succinate dehydrogenase / fumarate reductase, cytochrome b subunit
MAEPKLNHRVVPPRSGQGHSFFLRRLHSLTGIVPVGAFLIEHFYSNAYAIQGPGAYTKQVETLGGLPFILGMEIVLIWAPILYHGLYGFYIWYRGDSNVMDYPWLGNWMYTAQRWTGAITFFYMAWHVWHLRFTGVHILSYPATAFGKVQMEFHNPWAVAFYGLGIFCACWHFAYGLWLFAAKWGITEGPVARRRWGYICFMIAIVFMAVGAATMYSFLTTPPQSVQPPVSEMESVTMR